jgi:hypothetical protein
MKTFDFYNPITHHGILPVRVLQHNIIDWFENTSPDLLEDMIGEYKYNELQNAIEYRIERNPITDVCEISEQKQFILYENYNQFLWSTCYSIIVLFDEAIQIPTLLGNYNGKIDYDNVLIRRAVATFKEGFSLFRFYNDSPFFALPNPEKYSEYEQKYIEKASGVFLAAMTYILVHEFGHQYFGHLNVQATPDERRKDEFVVDDFAYDKISTRFDSEYGSTYKLGLLTALTSLYFLDEKLTGGDYHPDPDSRLIRQLNKMGLSDRDNLWGVASLSFRLWTIVYNQKIDFSSNVNNYKELFEITLDIMKEVKHTAKGQ